MLARWPQVAEAAGWWGNVQSAVDTKHHLIVEHEVTNIGSDRSQLSRMTERARTAIGSGILNKQAEVAFSTWVVIV